MSNIWSTSTICQCPATTQSSPKTTTLWRQQWETKMCPMRVLSISRLIKQPLISNELTRTVIVIKQLPNKAFQVPNAYNISTSRCSIYRKPTSKTICRALNLRVLSAMMNFPITVRAWTWIRLLMLVKAGIWSSSIHLRSNCRHQWAPDKSKSTQPTKSLQEWHRPPKLSKAHMSPSNTSKPNK